jgi:hypothetical protein
MNHAKSARSRKLLDNGPLPESEAARQTGSAEAPMALAGAASVLQVVVGDGAASAVAQTPTQVGCLTGEERARRLKVEVDRLARLPTVEWMFYLETEDYSARFGVDNVAVKKMVEAVVKALEKQTREDKADQRYEQRRAEQERDREDKRARQDEVCARKEADRIAREEARIAHEVAAKRKKREAAFAEIADLPKLTHETRLKEAAARLGEDVAIFVEEFGVYLAARTIPEHLEPWPDPVDTAELLAEIEAKFRRYVVASDAIVIASVLWALFTYIVEVAVHAPKLLYTFPVRNAGKTTALHVVRWMAQRSYAAVEATGAVLYRIIDRLKPTLFLDEADSLFQRRTALAHIVNESWTNSGSKIPRARASGKGYDEYDVYGTQAIGMRGLKVPDTTLSRTIICLIWPKLASEPVEEFGYQDDDEFKTIRRKLQRWAIDNAVALRAAKPEFPPVNSISRWSFWVPKLSWMTNRSLSVRFVSSAPLAQARNSLIASTRCLGEFVSSLKIPLKIAGASVNKTAAFSRADSPEWMRRSFSDSTEVCNSSFFANSCHCVSSIPYFSRSRASVSNPSTNREQSIANW